MPAKTCVFCTGELQPVGKPNNLRNGKYSCQFQCKICKKKQSKVLEPNDPCVVYASKRTKSKKGDKAAIAPVERPKIKLPADLAKAQPTPAALARHTYQRKLAAHYAPHILPQTFQGLRDGVTAGNTTAIKMVLELYELVQSDKRVSIVNDNRSVTVNAGSGRGGDSGPQRRSFESIARQLETSREKRIAQGNPLAARIIDAEFSDTPEGVAK